MHFLLLSSTFSRWQPTHFQIPGFAVFLWTAAQSTYKFLDHSPDRWDFLNCGNLRKSSISKLINLVFRCQWNQQAHRWMYERNCVFNDMNKVYAFVNYVCSKPMFDTHTTEQHDPDLVPHLGFGQGSQSPPPNPTPLERGIVFLMKGNILCHFYESTRGDRYSVCQLSKRKYKQNKKHEWKYYEKQ